MLRRLLSIVSLAALCALILLTPLTLLTGCSSEEGAKTATGELPVIGEWEGIDRASQGYEYGFYFTIIFHKDNTGAFRYHEKQTDAPVKELAFQWDITDENTLILENFPCVSDESYHLIPDADITLRLQLLDNPARASRHVSDSDSATDGSWDIRKYNASQDANVDSRKYSADEYQKKRETDQKRPYNGSWYITGNSLLLSFSTIYHGSETVEVEANPIFAYRK